MEVISPSNSVGTEVNADSLPTGVLPAVPMITGCRTQGQIAVTYVRTNCLMACLGGLTFQCELTLIIGNLERGPK